MEIPKIKTHTFYGKKFKVKFGKIEKLVSKAELKRIKEKYEIPEDELPLALTDDRGTVGREILISDTIHDDKTLLRVLIDEALHACDERLDNDIVDAYATSISNFLWRCGYRRKSKQADGLAK